VRLVELLARCAENGVVSEDDPGRAGHVLTTEGTVPVDATDKVDEVVIRIRIGVEWSL